MRNSKAKCIECSHCNAVLLLCHPQSEDCLPEYKLDENDLYTAARCDFFEESKK